jgi:carbonic anhydrase
MQKRKFLSTIIAATMLLVFHAGCNKDDVIDNNTSENGFTQTQETQDNSYDQQSPQPDNGGIIGSEEPQGNTEAISSEPVWTRAVNDVPSAEQALQWLQQGNERFLDRNLRGRHDFEADFGTLVSEQHPFAVILSCSDSRVSPELLFDMKPGDLFTIANAGSTPCSSALGSLEFAVGILGTPLIVVMGHTGCDIISGALESTFEEMPDNLRDVIDSIGSGLSGAVDRNDATVINIRRGMSAIENNEVVANAGATVIGAIYDVGSGTIEWLPPVGTDDNTFAENDNEENTSDE